MVYGATASRWLAGGDAAGELVRLVERDVLDARRQPDLLGDRGARKTGHDRA